MKKRLFLMLLAALTNCGTALWAQDAAMKTRMAEIRKCYAEALQLAENGMKDASKTLIHVEYNTTDPNWKQHYTIDYFFDNKQNARSASEAAMGRFKAAYPGHGAYRSFASPYFKVTVGDFRTKSEAMQLMRSLKSDFPSAFVVKENINYPIVDRSHAYVVDTVAVART